MKRNLTVILALLSVSILSAQESGVTALSLKESVRQAVEKNINMVKAQIDKEKNDYKVSEARSALFPKINASGNFQDNLQLPTTMIPGEIFGQPGTNIAVQLGSPYSAAATVSLNQILYNQTAFTALKLSKRLEELSNLSIEKASEIGRAHV